MCQALFEPDSDRGSFLPDFGGWMPQLPPSVSPATICSGVSPLRYTFVPTGSGSYLPTRATSAFAGIWSSIPRHQKQALTRSRRNPSLRN